jgi:hypothetical protein
MTAHLPVTGSDLDVWGTDLNDFLAVSLDPADGTLKQAAVEAALGGSLAARSGVGPATLGAELLTNGSVLGNSTGWTLAGATYSANALHFANPADACSQAINVVAGQKYLVEFAQTPWPASDVGDYLTVALGTATGICFTGGKTGCVVTANTTGAVTFSVTATVLTVGPIALHNFSCKPIAAVTVPATQILSGAVAIADVAVDAANSNLGVGASVLGYNVDGAGLTAFGKGALDAHSTGDGLVAVGNNALGSSLSCEYSTAVGSGALAAAVNDYDCTAVGQGALQAQNGAYQNTAVGTLAGRTITTGNRNTAVGNSALDGATTASQNVAVGNHAMGRGTVTITGSFNTAVGEQSVYAITTGQKNTGVGQGALHAVTTGSGNTAVGQNAGDNITTASNNVAVGITALSTAQTVGPQTAVGYSSLANANNSSAYNTAVGAISLYNVTTGQKNTGVGDSVGAVAGKTTATGIGNTFVGYNAGPGDSSDPSYTTALGCGVTVIGSGSVAIGTDHTGAGAAAIVQDQIALGTANHHLLLKTAAAPADAALAASQFTLWLDATNGAAKLMIKAKQADGTVKTATIALA